MEKFKLIFEGLHRAYGTFKEEDEDEKGKKKGKAYIIKAPVTDDLWQNHLSGKANLGIIPIRDDSKCRWGCIDVDSYTLDHKAILSKLKYVLIEVIPAIFLTYLTLMVAILFVMLWMIMATAVLWMSSILSWNRKRLNRRTLEKLRSLETMRKN